MLEIGTSGSMSGEGKRGAAAWPTTAPLLELYHNRRLHETNPSLRRRRKPRKAAFRCWRLKTHTGRQVCDTGAEGHGAAHRRGGRFA